MKIEIKNRFTGEVIYTHEQEGNTIALTVKYAIEAKANLRGANLRGADLRGADLSDADLSDADLSCANMSDANLRGADLRGADLRGADLSCANLSDANLRGADLSRAKINYAIGDMCIIYSMQLEKWNIAFTEQMLAIGCQQNAIDEWRVFSDDVIASMDSVALDWWKKWKEFIFKAIELCGE